MIYVDDDEEDERLLGPLSEPQNAENDQPVTTAANATGNNG